MVLFKLEILQVNKSSVNDKFTKNILLIVGVEATTAHICMCLLKLLSCENI